jgi:hypothetical protein
LLLLLLLLLMLMMSPASNAVGHEPELMLVRH